ncbi:DUF3316 domain-containing protein [Photobacterium sanctipauli]|uniref:DUF3316 domain-containing protein n=1 Tax=Photobacterium sanctipauli TaxID=1342794 RepID=A0A2T3NWI5_9GAMM|nr:DUF3316 domain-containing protein [Photobacterium sanctipauli]PSW20615.1 DUF3316 domain-containing protein [Photobacterium sanctipauli]
MNKLLVAAIVLSFSSASYGFTRNMNSESTHITAGVSDSREAAYQQGQALSKSLQSESPRKLKRTLGIYEYGLKTNTIKVNESNIEVDEFSTVSGDVKYRAIVNVNYSYDKYESDNR